MARRRNLPQQSGRRGWRGYLARIAFGLFLGIIGGLASLGDLRMTKGMQTLATTLLMIALVCYAVSFFPLVGWLMKSAQRGLLPGLTKGRAETFIWQNIVAAVVAACLVRAVFATH